ncbi:hypothetical protein BMS3Abin08_02014 [bacterium BMS3Abin08]|nr:hypothetical protein BMS3Abin08_02014 [bacterium BMS3Abin08]
MKRLVFVFTLLLVLSALAVAEAGYRDLFRKQFIDEPWAGAPIVKEGVCIECHTSKLMKPDYLKIPQEWKMSIHYKNNVSCHDCHGGNPNDSAISCSTPHSGFIGTPKYDEVPQLCGKCHIGILKSYLISGHGKALKAKRRGPNCVTCHGSHSIQKANIDIINSVRCTQCHSYNRARIMKQALFLTEKRMSDLDKEITALKAQGVITNNIDKRLFRTQAEFRTIFHTVDVSLVKKRTGEFSRKLDVISKALDKVSSQLSFRKNFSAFLFMLFLAMGIVVVILIHKGSD